MDLVRRLSYYVEKNDNFEGRLKFIKITLFKINLSINVGLVVAFFSHVVVSLLFYFPTIHPPIHSFITVLFKKQSLDCFSSDYGNFFFNNNSLPSFPTLILNLHYVNILLRQSTLHLVKAD